MTDDSSKRWGLSSPGSLVLLICLGGLVGGIEAALGLTLAAGGVRFSILAALVGVSVWLVSRVSARPAVAEALRLSGRVGALVLTAVCGAAAGLWGLGRVSADALSPLWLAAALLLMAIAAGAGVAFEWRGKPQRIVPSLLLTFVVGAAVGVALAQLFTRDTAKYAFWGVGSGGALAMALSWLLALRPPHADNRTGRWVENGLLFLAAAVLLYSSALPHGWNGTGVFNLYTYQAISAYQGRLDVSPISPLDISHFNGLKYVPFSPFPTVVLLPFAWTQINAPLPFLPMSLISACLGGLCAVCVLGILRTLGVERRRQYWGVVAFMFGTGLWTVIDSTSDLASYFAHVVAVPCLLLAIWEALGKRRGLLAGLFLGMAFDSRPITVLAAIFVLALLLEPGRGRSPRQRLLNCLSFGVGAGIFGVAFLLFNQLRFGDPFEMGHTFVNNGGYLSARLREYGVFNLAYVPSNFYYLFLHGFTIRFGGRDLLTPIGPDQFGTSLTAASPFAFLAIWGRWKKHLVWAAWASILGMIVMHLLYHTQGYAQVNTQRYTLDYFPILIILIVLGAQRIKRGVFEGLAIYAIVLNLIVIPLLPLSGLF